MAVVDSRAKEWLDRGDKAFERLAPQFALRQLLYEMFFPERASFFSEGLVGDEYYRELYNANQVLMRWRLGNAIGAMSRGRGREWFEAVSFPYWLNERQDVADWNTDTTKTQRSIFYDPRAQASQALALSDQDYAVAGYSPVRLTTNSDNTGVLYQTLHPKTCAPEENSEGVIDITHEKPRLTGRVITQMFGKRGKLSPAMKKAIERDPLEEIEIPSCVFPLKDYEPSKKRPAPKGAKFVVLYMDRERADVIQEEYFYSFPIIWRRWMRSVAGSPLGLSPCAMVALADANMSQEVRRSLIEAINYAADPARRISAGAIEGGLDLAPGGDNFVKRNYDFRTGEPIKAIDTGQMPDHVMEFDNNSTAFMGQCWLINLLTLPTQPKTAYEAERILDQDAREATPIFEPMEADNATMMGRQYDIANRWRAFAQKPKALERADVRHEFETPISLALRRLRAQQGVQVVSAVGSIAELEANYGKTAAFRRIDWPQLQKDMIAGIGPKNWMLDEEQAAELVQGDEAQKSVLEALQIGKEAAAVGTAIGPSGEPLALPAPQPAAQPVAVNG